LKGGFGATVIFMFTSDFGSGTSTPTYMKPTF
jgi:hypothetical protein